MGRYLQKFFIRDLEAGDLLEDFLVSATLSILSVRLFLHLTHYPQLGGERLHIAHMLYGGFIMMAAVVLMLAFVHREVKQVGSIVGGIGFGLFLDELGKFLTRDNNYFFEPTIALIYVVFILLFLIFRASDRIIEVDEDTYAVNALELMKDLVMLDLNTDEKKLALSYLRKADKSNPLVPALIEVLKSVRATPAVENEHIITILRRNVLNAYDWLIHQKYFSFVMIAVFVVDTLWHFTLAIYHFHSFTSFFDVGLFISIILSSLLVTFGIGYLATHERLKAYIVLKYAVLISIFLTQFFLFYQEQLSAITQLVVSLLVYIVLRVLITQELRLTKEPESFLEKIKNAIF